MTLKEREQKQSDAEISWLSKPNALARYNGRYSTTLRTGYVVRVIAPAPGNRMVVEGVGKKGQTVQFAVKVENLRPITDSLFVGEDF
ncbi:hypothetical protein LGM85_22515 [Burkholderia multivorans]|uniref:hypothetical protein n=1 Tax=Burkholderia multivorans TaxID=87883 RepID=UPI00158CEE7E|nr:hypothetical protein [Burkholderia multivorans]MBY4672306.1 hypothetical protein [Burkholderia multivorans]MCA8486709.1 hypothetical protein [Burkholderia multivorans]MDR8877612.1 hypothetical protein [Burkholderia multivorans]MDR8883519.1 hypothetical protein [Burkholderia multivorans]MDR8889935.1 hypothetical protein [Burkholderia multivorans]